MIKSWTPHNSSLYLVTFDSEIKYGLAIQSITDGLLEMLETWYWFDLIDVPSWSLLFPLFFSFKNPIKYHLIGTIIFT